MYYLSINSNYWIEPDIPAQVLHCFVLLCDLNELAIDWLLCKGKRLSKLMDCGQHANGLIVE